MSLTIKQKELLKHINSNGIRQAAFAGMIYNQLCEFSRKDVETTVTEQIKNALDVRIRLNDLEYEV